MIKIIINADDLGKSHEVNESIAEALEGKHITSSTILANSSTWDEVHRIVDDHSEASFGVHLNLTEGKALTDSLAFHKYGIVDDENCFRKSIREVSSYPDELLRAVYDEWDAQIDMVKNVERIPITHFDGHHHVHSIYAFADILCQLGEKYDVHKLRNRYFYPRGRTYDSLRFVARIPILDNIFCGCQGRGKLSAILQREAENALWQKKIKKVFRTPEYFNAYEGQVELLKSGIQLPAGSIVELMCHPGHKDFKEEYMSILNKAVENNINGKVSYINYRKLKWL